MTDPVIVNDLAQARSLGQKLAAESIPVVLASDYSIVVPAPVGGATEDKQDDQIVQETLINTNLTSLLTRLTGSFVPAAFDYVAYTSGASNDVYVYKTGGAGGTTVKTVTITYTDTTKTVLATVAAT